MHSDLLLDHFRNPRNAGVLAAPAVTIEVTNPACGDVLRLSVEWFDGKVGQIRFQARGCTASIAAGSAVTELLQGRNRSEIAGLTAAEIEAALGGLPDASRHAAVLARDAARALLTSAP